MTESEKRIVVVDFDGTICQYERGWQGAYSFEDPVEGASESLAILHSLGFKVIVQTCRTNVSLIVLHDGLELRGAMAESQRRADSIATYMDTHFMYWDEISTRLGKEIGDLYVDDRNPHWNGWVEEMKAIERWVEVKAIEDNT